MLKNIEIILGTVEYENYSNALLIWQLNNYIWRKLFKWNRYCNLITVYD